MANELIKSLFANDIHRRIEEVIKVDQTSDDILRDEINEYVVTDAIRSHYTSIFDALSRDAKQAARGYCRSGCLASSALVNPALQRCSVYRSKTEPWRNSRRRPVRPESR